MISLRGDLIAVFYPLEKFHNSAVVLIDKERMPE
jgi:hypothetical protein